MFLKLIKKVFPQKNKSPFSWGHGDGADVALIIKEICGKECSPVGEFGLKIYNDDKTPMDYVVWFMCEGLGMEFHVATNAMLEAHNKGEYIIVRGSEHGIIEIVNAINRYSHQLDLPLRCEGVKI